MKKFLVLYSAPTETRERMQNASKEEMKDGMKQWTEWFGKVGENMVDKGMLLTNAMTLTQDGEMPGNVDIIGYTVVQADSIDEAMKLVKSNPHMRREGAEIELHEMVPMPGM